MALSAFPGMTPQQEGAHTVLTGWLDQSALYGVLAEMEALGLVLLEAGTSTRSLTTSSRTTRFAIMQSVRLDRGPSGPVHP
jgi:hypothetical protein